VILGLINAGLPDQRLQTDVIDASLLVPVNKSTSLRFLLRHEIGKYQDPHYDGVAANRVPYTTGNPAAYLDSGPQDYHITALGVLVQVKW
jgi:hypothetical protein